MRRRSFLKLLSGALAAQKYPPLPAMAQTAKPAIGPDGDSPTARSGPRDFLKFAKELRKEKRTVVGVFNDARYQGREVPAGLRAEDFIRSWGAKPNIRVVLLDIDDMRSYSILFKGKMDVLVYPYGALNPIDDCWITNGDALRHFLKRGGAVLTTGGVPFGDPVDDKFQSPDPAAIPGYSGCGPVGPSIPATKGIPNNETYGRNVAPFGFKYYEHPYPPSVSRVNRDFLPSLPATLPVAPCSLGLIANISAHEPVPAPSHGNVFPERYPVKQIVPLLCGMDDYGQVLATNAILVQDYQTGSRSVHFAHQAEPHPLSPSSPHFEAIMDDILALLTNKIFVKNVEPSFACYRPGETVRARAEFANFSRQAIRAQCHFEISDGKQNVHEQMQMVEILPGATAAAEFNWLPDRFQADEYQIRAALHCRNTLVSRAENAFVVWDQKTMESGPQVRLQGQYFRIGESDTWVSGTNYYESTRGEIMWFRPDVKRVSEDLRQMRRCGINYLRPHYHHYKWFKDYLQFQYDRLPPYFEELEDWDDPLPSEKAWRNFDMMILLCQKNGIVYGGDLFTMIPEEMGDPRGWQPLLERVYCEEMREVQGSFLKALNERYKNVPGIAWDLWNEPAVPFDGLRDWTREHRKTINAIAPRFITVGGVFGKDIGDTVDFVGLHVTTDDLAKTVNESSRPTLVQETYFVYEEDLASELLQAEDLRKAYLMAVKNGMCGFTPWSWTRQMRLWQDSYALDAGFRVESFDDRLGVHVHDDATLKPAGHVYRDLSMLLRTISFQNFDASSGRIQTTRGEVIVDIGDGNTSDHSLRHVSGDSCFSGMARGSIVWKGKTLCSGPASSYLLACADGEGDLRTSRRLLVKTEAPGELRVPARSDRLLSVKLVDLTPGGATELAELDWHLSGSEVVIPIRPNQQAYWAAIDW